MRASDDRFTFRSNNGEKLWVRTADFGIVMPTHQTNPYCGSTPVSDGQRVVVWHGSAGLFCYDLDGNVTGGFQGPALAVRLDSEGDVTETHRVWHVERNPQNIGSAIFVDGFI